MYNGFCYTGIQSALARGLVSAFRGVSRQRHPSLLASRGQVPMSRRQADAPAEGNELEISPEMIEAGVDRLDELLEAGTSSAYVVSEVYRAMDSARTRDRDR